MSVLAPKLMLRFNDLLTMIQCGFFKKAENSNMVLNYPKIIKFFFKLCKIYLLSFCIGLLILCFCILIVIT